jgi:hypothetical protein
MSWIVDCLACSFAVRMVSSRSASVSVANVAGDSCPSLIAADASAAQAASAATSPVSGAGRSATAKAIATATTITSPPPRTKYGLRT